MADCANDKGDINEAEVGIPGVDFKVEDEEQGDSGTSHQELGGGSASKRQRSSAPKPTYVPPFKPDLATVKRVSQMAKAISDWILSAIGTLFDAGCDRC